MGFEISKELWIKVINPNLKDSLFKDGVIKEFRIVNNMLNVAVFYEHPTKQNKGITHDFNINIYELAHKCKSWVYEQGYLIGLNSRQGVTLIDIQTNMVLRYITFDNLKQVIRFELNLCQWILDNQK